MIMYKALHKPTGLYYCPSRWLKINGRYLRSNLSKKGKLYTKPPKHFESHFTIMHNGEKLKTQHSDWTIEQL